MFADNGNKCGKCQNHDYEVLKKGHARDCPFKKCECLKCRLLDARSDILQVISGKETKLKGTKKDPHCGFCQNHNVKILRKGHVRSCDFGQERHFKLENCFDCEVHYIRNEVNRLQIKMRRAMKEDRTLSEEQRKTAREAITRDEVEKVCDMARLARRKRNAVIAAQQADGEASLQQQQQQQQHHHQQQQQQQQQLQFQQHQQHEMDKPWRPWDLTVVANSNNSMMLSHTGPMPELQQQPVDLQCDMQLAGCSGAGGNHLQASCSNLSGQSSMQNHQQQNTNFVAPPQNQPMSLAIPQPPSREQQFLNTLHLFRLMLQLSAQNQNAN